MASTQSTALRMGKLHSRRSCQWAKVAATLFALFLTLVTSGDGWEREDEQERAYIHWPPDGSRVSAGSLSAAGIRVEFSGIRDDWAYQYRATLSVAIGNITIVSEKSYRIECHGAARHDARTLKGNGSDDYANTQSAVRWLIPFSEAFQGPWEDNESIGSRKELEDDPLRDVCPVGDNDKLLTVAVRLFRGENGVQALLAAEASSKLRLLVKSDVGDVEAFAFSSGNDDPDIEGQVRSERIQVAFVETPGQFFTAAFLAEVGYTAVIRGLHLFSDYSVTLKLNGSLVMSEHLQPIHHSHGDSRRLQPSQRCLIQGLEDVDLTTGGETKLHSHLPLLPLGRHSARLEVRVGEETRPVATSDVELVVVGDHVEDALGYVEPTTADWVHDQAWCNASESNQQTCTPRGYRARGEGVPDAMRNPDEVCETLFDAGVRRIHVYGDSFARHLYIALCIISSGDYNYGALQSVEHGPQSNEWERRACCGNAQFSSRGCRSKISLQRRVCQGRITLLRAQQSDDLRPEIPANYSREDLVLLSTGRHERELARTGAAAPEPWLMPHWTPAHGPWEAEAACSLANRRAIEVWVRKFCRSADIQRRGGASPRTIFVNSHIMAVSNLANVCKHLEENPREKFDNGHAKKGSLGECKQKLDREWTPKCPQKLNKMAKWHSRYEEGSSTDLFCWRQLYDIQAMPRHFSKIWEEMVESHCGQDVHVVDVIPVTRSLVNNFVDDAIDMTYDGEHWGLRVNILEAQMILQKIWLLFRAQSAPIGAVPGSRVE